MKQKYSYTVLRYTHDVLTGEFQNIGLVLYSPETNFLRAKCLNRYGRLSKCFSNVDGDHFKRINHFLETAFTKLSRKLAEDLPFGDSPRNASTLVAEVLPKDDSTIQFSPDGSGIAENLEVAFADLYERMVERYIDTSAPSTRSDEDVWQEARKSFDDRGLQRRFQKLTITTADESRVFERVVFNGRPHVFEPVSFDLASPENMFKKAHRWVGMGYTVLNPDDAAEAKQLKLYLVIGKPKGDELTKSFQHATNLLKKIPCEKEIVFEEDVDDLAGRISTLVEGH